MKLSKAIEIGEGKLNANYKFLDPDFRDFIKLGIEALKRLKSLRVLGKSHRYSILPGETPEDAPG